MEPQLIAERAAWNRLLLALPAPHLLQSWEWGAVKGQTGWAAHRLAWPRPGQAAPVAAQHGLGLAYHNHWWEFQMVEGRLAFDVMLEHLDPAVGFEIDTYWVQTAGHDPAAVVQRLGDRAPLLHIKDGPATADAPMVAVGQGALDFPAIVAAASGARWLIVELDRCATDMTEAVRKSYAYLVKEGLARGNKHAS